MKLSPGDILTHLKKRNKKLMIKLTALHVNLVREKKSRVEERMEEEKKVDSTYHVQVSCSAFMWHKGGGEIYFLKNRERNA